MIQAKLNNSGDFIGEIGTVNNLNHQNKTIELQNEYVNPVVFALPISNNGGDPAIARITDIENDNFSVYIQEAEYEDGYHTNEAFTYMVVEAGTWELDDGTILQVGTVDTDNTTVSGWETIDFNTNFSKTPVILSQVQTDNDDTFVRTRQHKANASSFQLALEEEEKLRQSGHGKESVGWLAIETGKGTWNGMKYQAGSTGEQVTHQWHNLGFNDFSKTPNLLAALGSYEGGDSTGLRYTNLNSDGVKIRLEEDTSLDRETNHKNELVNFLAIEGSGNLTGVSFGNKNDKSDDRDDDDKSSPLPNLSNDAISVGFEQHKNGTTYNKSAQSKDWDVDWSVSSWMNKYATITNNEAHSGDKSLRVTHRPDARTGGNAAWSLPEEKEYYLSYWVKFSEDFDFDGDKYSGGKLPGLAGAGGYCSGGQTCNGNNGFSSRYMWRENGSAVLYLYHMDKPNSWGEDFKLQDISGNDVSFQRGQWHNLIQRVKINDGKKSNGEIDVWMDKEKVLSLDGLKFVTNNEGIDALMFNTFHGGGANKAWWPDSVVHSYYDDFVISTEASDAGL